MKELDILHNILADNALLSEMAYLEPKHFIKFGEEFGIIQEIYHETNHVDKISLDMHDIILPKLDNFVAIPKRAIKLGRMLFDSFHRDLAIGRLKGIEGRSYEDVRSQVKEILEESDLAFDKHQDEVTAESLLEPFIAKVIDARENDKPLGMQLNSLTKMNDTIGGILPTDLIGIYGKEKSSKSTLAMEMMLDLCVDQDHNGVIFSYEMDNDLVLMKALSMRTGININHLRNPDKRYLPDPQFYEYTSEFSRKLKNTSLYLVDELLDEYEFESKVKKLTEKGVQIVLIDYLMLIDARKRFKTTREELNYLSKFFKRMAKRLKVAVILISQANDTGEREAEAKGLSRDSNYYFYVAKLEIGDAVMDKGATVHVCAADDEYVIKNRGIRHGKTGSYFLTTFNNNKYEEKYEDHSFIENTEI